MKLKLYTILIITLILAAGFAFSVQPASLKKLNTDTTSVQPNLLAQYEPNYTEFERIEIGDLIVYWQQQTISNKKYTAIVEKAQKVYQFNKYTLELVKKIDTFDYTLPKELPKIISQRKAEALAEGEILPRVISQKKAESLAEGEVLFSNLYYISEDSDVFPVRTTNPCWIIRTVNNEVKIIDAITGEYLGDGIAPPADAFSFSGSEADQGDPCDELEVWENWYQSADTAFEEMGYNSYATTTPDTYGTPSLNSYVTDNDVDLFYEIAHGTSWGFYHNCDGTWPNGWGGIYASIINSWTFEKKPFAFFASCDGMCYTGAEPPITLSYAFRRGVMDNTTTVGYCGMSNSPCYPTCWIGYSVNWQNALFDYMIEGDTVYSAFNQADADYPACGSNNCMRFYGDQTYAVDLELAAGHECNADDHCFSGYCEGSEDNDARCCSSAPPNDGWYGGGNTAGCGLDSDSTFNDYYCDNIGEEQFEITETFSCDIDDDCGPNCSELSEHTDYYVISNTNTCTSVSFDADDSEQNCEDCMGHNYWNLGGDFGQCCSNDAGENVNTRICEADACNSNSGDDACCNQSTDCVYNSECYNDGHVGDIDNDSSDEECENGTWVAISTFDPQAPILNSPYNNHNFKLGETIHFAWQKASGTNPSKYWFRIYVNEISDDLKVSTDGKGYYDLFNPKAGLGNGFDMGMGTKFNLMSELLENYKILKIADGQIYWQIGSQIGSDIHWSPIVQINKKVAATLISPADGEILTFDGFGDDAKTWFKWNAVNVKYGVTPNYILKLTGGWIAGDWKNCQVWSPCYVPLGNTTKFYLTKEAVDVLLDADEDYEWAITATSFAGNSMEDPRWDTLYYSQPWTFVTP